MKKDNFTSREIIKTVRREKSTLLELQCGHDRSIGGNLVNDWWASGPAHMLRGVFYPCQDGHCGNFK